MARATLAGQSVDCLLDTGSQVPLVTEAFYKAHLQRDGHLLRPAHHWLTIRAADGTTVAGTTAEDRAILVVRDSGQQHPGLLEMNVPAHISSIAASLSQVANVDATRFARVATRRPICSITIIVASYDVIDVCGPDILPVRCCLRWNLRERCRLMT